MARPRKTKYSRNEDKKIHPVFVFRKIINFLVVLGALPAALCDSPQQGDLRLLGPPSGRGADGGARTHDRRVLADLRADSQATVPPTPHRRSRVT
ncbi:hypothetical protein PoB_005314700 [Plakobranchus ocellatus]|uniref:Uncharacterized protein n=1 Tax=Plakobranchus ocellatus TaxID=259542 RepID=A0AAV4C5U4_9GAST|nr:hypothetical protein PoB_005314700 [Plakobranchus ocellatus]